MHSDLLRTTSKVISLARCGRIACARKLFDEMSHKDVIAWNAMLTSYSHLGLHREALSLFHGMRMSNVRPDEFTFTSTLRACGGAADLPRGKKLHALVLLMGYQSFLPVNNSLIDAYAKCLSPSSASKVFDEMTDRNEVTWCSLLYAHANSGYFDVAHHVFHSMPEIVKIAWNIMIVGHARFGEIKSCLGLLNTMRKSFCKPDQWTFSTVMNACAKSLEFLYGSMVHACIIRSGWSSAVEAKNSVLSFYAELGCLDGAMKVFKSIETPTQVSWNAMIDAHMKFGDTSKASLVFHQLSEKNVVSWTSMVTGYARNGEGEEAIVFFVEMMRNCLQPDEFTFGAVLYACSSLAVLEQGQMVQGCIIRHGFHANLYVGNSLVNMYAKCGDLGGSSRAFSEILSKHLVSWNAMIIGFGLHGQASQALQVYAEMLSCGVKPDKVTFIGLLMTCSHSGLIEESRVFFESMRSVYGLNYDMDHVVCMVDILGRGGYISEAERLAAKYSTVGYSSISHEALLGACSVKGNIGIGSSMAEELKTIEPQRELSYVLLSNLYCGSERWKEAEMVRKAMADKGVKKMPGCSWIKVNHKVVAFVAGNNLYKYTEELSKVLFLLEFEIRNPCFVHFEI